MFLRRAGFSGEWLEVQALGRSRFLAFASSLALLSSPPRKVDTTKAAQHGRHMMAPTTRNAYGAPEQSEIPPATQASLLITSLTTRKRSGHGDNYIKDLLDEVGREEVDIDTKAVSQQLEHKHRLFYVTYKSVLEELGTDKPLKKQHKEVLEQAADTLDTFVNVIRELPEILLHVVNPEHPLRDRGTEPLWVWLFPRILRLLGHRQCSALTLQLKRFFGVASVMVGRSPKIWYLNSVFFGYIKDCATGKETPLLYEYLTDTW